MENTGAWKRPCVKRLKILDFENNGGMQTLGYVKDRIFEDQRIKKTTLMQTLICVQTSRMQTLTPEKTFEGGSVMFSFNPL